MAMKKLNEPSNEKDKEGNLVHHNVLKPVGIRWIESGPARTKRHGYRARKDGPYPQRKAQRDKEARSARQGK